MKINESFDVILDKLQSVLTTRTVVGDPIEIEGITMVPIMNVSFGFGAGGGEGTDKNNQGGSGGGGGAGAQLRVISIIAIQDGQVRVLPIGGSGAFEKLVETVPEIVRQLQSSDKENEKKSDT